MKSGHLEGIRAFGTALIVLGAFGAGLFFPLQSYDRLGGEILESYNWPLVIGYLVYAVVFFIVTFIIQSHLANQEQVIQNQEQLIKHFMPEAEVEAPSSTRPPEEKLVVRDGVIIKD